jgi:hypothetical protein
LDKYPNYCEERPWLTVVYDDTKQPSEAALEVAKAEYKQEHPDYKEQDFNVLWVTDEHAKVLAERLLACESIE